MNQTKRDVLRIVFRMPSLHDQGRTPECKGYEAHGFYRSSTNCGTVDVDNGDYHSLSQIEIDGGIEIYR